MTAEIVILNKTGIALAADSIVTLSTGSVEKVFETEDKLFELSDRCPIGIMIYNATLFMNTPLPNLVREFRKIYTDIPEKLEDAFEAFLNFLHKYYKSTSKTTKEREFNAEIETFTSRIFNSFKDNINNARFENDDEDDKAGLGQYYNSKELESKQITKIINDTISFYEAQINSMDSVDLFGCEDDDDDIDVDSIINRVVKEKFGSNYDDITYRISKLCKTVIYKNYLLGCYTGLVITGFGEKQLFPSLLSCKLNGVVNGRLRYVIDKNINMNEDESKAHILPFAQTEIVERFLFGIDQDIVEHALNFFDDSIENYRNILLNNLGVEDNQSYINACEIAEDEFRKKLKQRLEEMPRDNTDIESMVEYMPKPELASMAEALVNLTSIKRHVSSGIETVGGPIDVAVICRSEGFVWIRRKLYFPADLNTRYFLRLEHTNQTRNEVGYDHVQ